MIKRYVRLWILSAVFMAYGQNTMAELWENPAAVLSDRVHFSTVSALSQTGGTLDGFVDYTVYAPGQYSGSVSFDDNLYVYAYQVFNNENSTVGIDYFSIGLSPYAEVLDVTCDPALDYAVSGGSSPSIYFKLPESVIFMYQTDNLGANEYSQTLLFTSTYGPEMTLGYVSGGMMGGAGVAMPSPIPEPAAFSLMALCALPALRRRRISRFKRH